VVERENSVEVGSTEYLLSLAENWCSPVECLLLLSLYVIKAQNMTHVVYRLCPQWITKYIFSTSRRSGPHTNVLLSSPHQWIWWEMQKGHLERRYRDLYQIIPHHWSVMHDFDISLFVCCSLCHACEQLITSRDGFVFHSTKPLIN
jgi:hypothetical protein